MQKIKYIVFAVMIMIGLLVTGELYQEYLDRFDYFYYVTFYAEDETEYQSMLADISATACQYDVAVFAIEQEERIYQFDYHLRRR